MTTGRGFLFYAVRCLAFVPILLLVVYFVLNSAALTSLCFPRSRQRDVHSIQNSSLPALHLTSRRSIPFKQILIWNRLDRVETASFRAGYEAFLSNQCRYKHCVILTNASLADLSEVDAVIFNIPAESRFLKLPQHHQREPFQRYVFFSQESAFYLPVSPGNITNYFNWSTTYRRDSDIGLFYGRFNRRPKTARIEQVPTWAATNVTTNYAVNKTKLVAWFVSHCGTGGKREACVNELRNYITADVYGACGNMTCKRDSSGWLSSQKCYAMLENTYKFYLSFENSLCVDYVTEKFFAVMQRRLIPVVYGGANYSQIAPEHSYIDANLLPPKELAALLPLLDRNDTLYSTYFWWKEYYDVEAGVEQMIRYAFCDLCEKLHTDFETKVYYSVEADWDPKTQCTKPRQIF